MTAFLGIATLAVAVFLASGAVLIAGMTRDVQGPAKALLWLLCGVAVVIVAVLASDSVVLIWGAARLR